MKNSHINEFMTGLKSEARKITWLKKKDLVARTAAVVVVSALTGLFIAAIDRGVLYCIDLVLK